MENQWRCIEKAEEVRIERAQAQTKGRELFQEALSAETEREKTILLYLSGRIAKAIELADLAIEDAESAPDRLGRKNDPNDFVAGYNAGLDYGYQADLSRADFHLRWSVFEATDFIAIMNDYRAGHLGPAQMQEAIGRLLDRLHIKAMVDHIA